MRKYNEMIYCDNCDKYKREREYWITISYDKFKCLPTTNKIMYKDRIGENYYPVLYNKVLDFCCFECFKSHFRKKWNKEIKVEEI